MNYYFLVGYLPELQRDDRKIRVGLTELLGEQYNIASDDWKEIELILLGRDIFIIEKLLSGKTVSIQHSLYTTDFWRDQIKSPGEGPEFVSEFLKETEGGKSFGPGETDRLYAAYYDYVIAQSKNDLLRLFFGFERDLRNVVAALRARQKGLNVSDCLIGESELAETLGRSNAEDFGLGKEYSWIESLLTTDYPPQRQELIEQILWNYLDEHAGSDPFEFNTILSYVLKLQMLEKRLALSEEQGMAKVRRLEED